MPFLVSGIRLGTQIYIEECLICGYCRSHALHIPEPKIPSHRRPPSRVQRLVDFLDGLISRAKVKPHLYVPGNATVRNGDISKREHCDYLRKEMGYRLERCTGIPVWEPTEEELEQMAAADRQLGIHRGESGETILDRDIKKATRDLLAPLRRSTYRKLFK